MSNNSYKELGIYKAKENAPDHIVKILSVLEDTLREFNVIVKYQGNTTVITIQDKDSFSQGVILRTIFLEIFSEPKSYSMKLFHQMEGDKNQEQVYEIKVKGNYELITLKKNLEKLIRGENLTHRPRFYPF